MRRIRFEGSGLNLVSLMDIFTILLLFLLVHIPREANEIQPPSIVKLPSSTSSSKLKSAPIVYITTQGVLIDNTVVASTQKILMDKEKAIDLIKEKLLSRDEGKKDKIIIMGDREIPFTILKRTMDACTKAGYEDIILAVIKK